MLPSVRDSAAVALPTASVLTLLTVLVHVASGGSTPSAAAVLVAVAMTRAVLVVGTRVLQGLGRRRAALGAFAAAGSLQAVSHHLFATGAGEARILTHHGHVVGVHATAHGSHAADATMVLAHVAVALVTAGLIATCDELAGHVVATLAHLRWRWARVLTGLVPVSLPRVARPAGFRVERAPSNCARRCHQVRGPPVAI